MRNATPSTDAPAGSDRPEPRARLRLSLSDLLLIHNALGREVDTLSVEELMTDPQIYRLYKRLAPVIVGLADKV